MSQALGYLEREAGEVRRGKDGRDRLPGGGFVAAAFRHRTSRAGDPQLHTHVLVANMTRGSDGRWSALDGRQLYLQAKTAGTLYQAALRDQLAPLGLAWVLHPNGTAEIDGIPRSVLRGFSRRREQIEAELAAHGAVGAEGGAAGHLGHPAGQAARRGPGDPGRAVAGPGAGAGVRPCGPAAGAGPHDRSAAEPRRCSPRPPTGSSDRTG